MHATTLAATVLEIFGVVGVIVLLVLVAGVTFFAYQFFQLRRAVAAAMRTMPDVLAQLAEANRRAASDAESDRSTLPPRASPHRDAFLLASGWSTQDWAERGGRVMFVTDATTPDEALAPFDMLMDPAAEEAFARAAAADGIRAAFAAWSTAHGMAERVVTFDAPQPTDAYLARR